MKRTLAILFLLLTTSAFAAEPRDYSGTWLYDAAVSKDVPQMFAGVTSWKLTVAQKTNALSVRAEILNSNPQMPAYDETFNYTLDGIEQKTATKVFTPAGPKDVPTTLLASVADAGAVDVVITREITRGEQMQKMVIDERWTLSEDGKTLTIHRKDNWPQPRAFDVVFRKQ